MNNLMQSSKIISPDLIAMNELQPEHEETEFVKNNKGYMECHGRIIEIDHQELFCDRMHKMFNSVFRGEPYQFAHQTVEYTIRVERMEDVLPTDVADFSLYGNYLGRLQVGDEVLVRAKNLKDRRVVKSIYNETTGSIVNPGLQIPASVIRGGVGGMLFAIIAFVCGIIWIFESGIFMAILIAMMPVFITCIGFWILIKSVLPKRKRR